MFSFLIIYLLPCVSFPADYADHVSIKFTFLMYVNYLSCLLLSFSLIFAASAKFYVTLGFGPRNCALFLWSMGFVYLCVRSWSGGQPFPRNSELTFSAPLSHLL
ncbi:hypothetical protein BDV28DRAFT_132072 [Aspergillus coremiiformis]|uniref:Chitin synthase export chaperone n=1 Tax=Aspergillus coremiiformis TaxID=138285 RepID=A0A5N6Z9S6_9EURO|nr:hypothetical protein BDV28DRAFT_132072 [Aspergillus coremiiformis]